MIKQCLWCNEADSKHPEAKPVFCSIGCAVFYAYKNVSSFYWCEIHNQWTEQWCELELSSCDICDYPYSFKIVSNNFNGNTNEEHLICSFKSYGYSDEKIDGIIKELNDGKQLTIEGQLFWKRTK